MSRLSVIALVALLALGVHANRSSQQQSREQMEAGLSQQPKPFRQGHEYTFAYNSQICTGLQQDPTTAGESAKQKSATRIQAQAKIQFHSDRHATLRLEQIRLGQLNERVEDPKRVQPMGMFEQKRIDSDKRRELEQPCSFTYEDGVVVRVQFHPDDSTWSKNIKRSVLNLIQLNLKQNNAQGVRGVEQIGQQPSQQQKQPNSQEQLRQQLMGDEQAQSKFTKTFTQPEITIEGECMTTYTINKAQQFGQSSSEQKSSSREVSICDTCQNCPGCEQLSFSCPNCFNVTKSINFKRCSKIADVAYGYQTQQQQPQCAQCQQWWARQQQEQQQQGSQQSGKQDEQQQPHPCDQCDPKEVKENQLDRSTVQRFVLAGKQEKYGIKRAELVSQYLYKNLRTGADPQSGATMQAVVACELVFRGVREQSPKGGNAQVQQLQAMKASSEREESLLFSNAWDTEEKRFYMYGDAEFIRNSPFSKVTSKVDVAIKLLNQLIQAASNKASGIEVDDVVQIQRLAEQLRMCSMQELKNIQETLRSQQQQQGRSDAEQQKQEHILGDALAIAGTRNTIEALAQQILTGKLQPAKAMQTLKALQGLPAPSDDQVMIISNLCQNELMNRNPGLKQSCWLTFGQMVGEVCLHKTQKNAQQSAFGAQSGFNKDEICPQHKKEIYKKTLIEKYQQARTTYQKVLALKALGNAGIDIAVPTLEQIVQKKREQRIVRVTAIDSLRRLRTQMPRKIQRILLPIFQNTREHPQVRMAAFSMIMNTQPEQQCVDQITYTLSKERSQQVQSFVYTTMKALSKSKVPQQQQLAKSLKSALKLAQIDESELRGSRRYQVPIYCEQEQEGLFLTLTSVLSSRNVIPSHVAVSLDSLLNGEFEMNNVKVGMTQVGIEQWFEKLMHQIQRAGRDYQQGMTRGQRDSRQQQSGSSESELTNIFKKLGIQKRKQNAFSSAEEEQRSGEQQDQDQQQPFGMINVRIGDVDQCMLSIDKQSLPQFLRGILNGQKPSMSQLMGLIEPQTKHFRLLTALNIGEKSAKIATPMGVPLRVLTSVPILAQVEGEVKISESSDRLESGMSPKAQLKMTPSISVAHIQRMETWMPVITTGVESVRCAEANLPIQFEAEINRQDGLKVSIRLPLPGSKTKLFGLHSLPVTYTRDFDQKTKQPKAPRVRNIHNEELDQLERQVNMVVGAQAFGMPIHVRGHLHRPVTSITDPKALLQVAMATENQVHVAYEPNEQSPRTIRLTARAGAFQSVEKESSHAPELKEFYSQQSRFDHAYPADYEDMQLESHDKRRDMLNSYLQSFQPGRMYKHQLKLTVQTEGAAKRFHAEAKVDGACDSRFKYCKAFVQAERTPMYAEEQSQWVFKSKVQTLMPERVSSVQQLSNSNNNGEQKRQQKFVCQADSQWGTSERKQFLNVRIQGERAEKPQWRQHIDRIPQEQQRQQAAKQYKKRTAFLNKFDCQAEYKLSAQLQNAFQSCFETLKAYNFWNTQQQQNGNNALQGQGEQGRMYATLVIDPISQKHVNISVKTPQQQCRIERVQLPTQIRPFPLVRQQQKQTHSVGQLFQQLHSSSGRAECRADGKRVDTFDNVLYKAPISKCYSVLAKDCANERPQFSVLMKSLQSGQPDAQSAKKIKVITPRQVIECQPKSAENPEGKLKCKVNGQSISGEEQREMSVEYDNQEKTSCTINVPGVQVRFNGQKCVIRISNAYKEAQCGLCGHYNDEQKDEWRMSNNQQTNDLGEFHRSFSIQDNQECSEQERDDFYKQHQGKFQVDQRQKRRRSQKLGKWAESGDDEGYYSDIHASHINSGERDYDRLIRSSSSSSSSQQDRSEEQSWWGPQKQRPSWRRQQQKQKGQKMNSQESQEYAEEPVKKTKVIEYNHMICFSTQPVKQCPEGTHPAQQPDQQQGNDYSNGSSQEQQRGQQPGQKKMPFACLPRSSIEARRLQRQARQGVVVDVSSYTPSFVESVKQPQRCVRY